MEANNGKPKLNGVEAMTNETINETNKAKEFEFYSNGDVSASGKYAGRVDEEGDWNAVDAEIVVSEDEVKDGALAALKESDVCNWGGEGFYGAWTWEHACMSLLGISVNTPDDVAELKRRLA